MSEKLLTARKTDVYIGNLILTGLMAEDKKYYVAVPQAADILETSRSTASRDFKRLMGKDFKTSKLKTEFNKNTTIGIPLPEFEKLLFELALKGNDEAIKMCRSLIGLSLQQLFSDAFNEKFEKEERQEYLKWRQVTRIDFHPKLTNAMQRNLNIRNNEWGKYIKEFQDSLNIESGTRNELNPEQLTRLAMAQHTAAVLLDAGLSWKTVLTHMQK